MGKPDNKRTTRHRCLPGAGVTVLVMDAVRSPIIPGPIFEPSLLTDAPRCRWDREFDRVGGREDMIEFPYWGPPLAPVPPISEWPLLDGSDRTYRERRRARGFSEGTPKGVMYAERYRDRYEGRLRRATKGGA